ncbi:Putative polyferredoxin [Cronobacter sakazakii 701]|nr:Putative polyferredoxin [Cronobacter sakazakii 701]
MLDTTRCLLCGACGRACASGAIRFGEQDFTLNTGCCDGCGDCAAVCPVDAFKKGRGFNPRACERCGEPWRAWHPGEKVCPVCQRHGFSMRGG